MGWLGYGIYDGDETQTQHIDFLKWAKVTDDEVLVINEYFTLTRTVLPKAEQKTFLKNIDKVIKKMPKRVLTGNFNEDAALEWQMLAALFVDNRMPIPRIIKNIGLNACDYLLYEHSDDFREPSKRRAKIKAFITKLKKLRVLRNV